MLGVEPPQGFDARLDLLAGRRGDRRPSAPSAKLTVNPAVRLAGAVLSGRHEGVEFAAQLAQLAMHGRRRRRHSLAAGGPPLQLFVLAAVQQRPHLIRVEQPRQTEVVGFLVAAGRGDGGFAVGLAPCPRRLTATAR